MTQEGSKQIWETPFGVETIKKIIPHREPFILIDEIVQLNPTSATAIKHVNENEYYFKGHFPNHPVMPGVLILEAMAQTLGVMMVSKQENEGKIGYFSSLNNVRFRGIVSPGCDLRLEVKQLKQKSKFCVAEGKAFVEDKLMCEAELMIFVDKQQS